MDEDLESDVSELRERFSKLEQDFTALKAERDRLQAVIDLEVKGARWLTKASGFLFLGPQLGLSLRKWLGVVSREKRIPIEESADLLAAIIGRVIGNRLIILFVGILGIVPATLTLVLLHQQNRVLQEQSTYLLTQTTNTTAQTADFRRQNELLQAQIDAQAQSDLLARRSTLLKTIYLLDPDTAFTNKAVANKLREDAVRDYVRVERALSNKVSLKNAPLKGLTFEDIDFRNVNFSGSDMRDIKISGANLDGAVLSGADCENGEFMGVTWNNADLAGANFRGTSLFSAQFNGAFLLKTLFAKARIDQAVFDGAYIHRCDFTEATLRGASMKNVDLRGSIFSNAQLANISMAFSDCSGVDFSHANLEGADLATATFGSISIDEPQELYVGGRRVTYLVFNRFSGFRTQDESTVITTLHLATYGPATKWPFNYDVGAECVIFSISPDSYSQSVKNEEILQPLTAAPTAVSP